MIKVTYLDHCGFEIVLDRHVLIFDFIPKGSPGAGFISHAVLSPFDRGKNVVFFSSCRNPDHFSPEIFKYIHTLPHVRYVFSSDIKIGDELKNQYHLFEYDMRKIKKMHPRTDLELGEIKIKSLRSTGSGVSYVVDCEGLRLYHAGNMNIWNLGDTEDLMYQTEKSSYRRELKIIKGTHVDLAFVVLDGRLGRTSFDGIKYYLMNITTDLIFPMHLFGKYDLVRELKRDPEIVNLRDRIIDIDRPDIVFDIPDER